MKKKIKEKIKEKAEVKPVICGHEEIAHEGEKWFRCGGHGEHILADCQKLCV